MRETLANIVYNTKLTTVRSMDGLANVIFFLKRYKNNTMEILIKVKVKDWQDNDIKVGDYIEYQGEVYIFDGYEYGTYPYATNVETGEQIQLPHY